ncbi:GLPGLI family protein [Edaphocola flava]|uniref:GLPGLI family protein n=1 Tax=Edaphocola flava TaxID=2499629 RepID=UPI0013873ED7|nr:GLPGLI family protein [Edaphocola flava]
MKALLLMGCALLMVSVRSTAQFTSSGSIEYLKTTNVRLGMQLEMDDDEDSEFMKEYIKKLPKNKTVFFKMDFDKKKSTYFYDKDGPEKIPMWGGKDPAGENIVLKNFTDKTIAAQKEVYDNTYIVKDSLPKYQWKILDEMRPIAGYNCRKATTVIDDTVVVVAYYTEQIMVSGGPESFGGLPGMILGLAIPRLYTTWFATKVSNVQLHENEVKKIGKGKEINNEQLFKVLQPRLKEWGKYGTNILWKIRI